MNPYPFPTENPYPWPTEEFVDLVTVAFGEPSSITLTNLQASIQTHPIAWLIGVALFAIAVLWLIAKKQERK